MSRFIPITLAFLLIVISIFEGVTLFATGIAIDFIKRDQPFLVAQFIISGFQFFTALMLLGRFNVARGMLLWGMPLVLIGTLAVYVDAEQIGAVYWINYFKLVWYILYAVIFTRPALADRFKNSF